MILNKNLNINKVLDMGIEDWAQSPIQFPLYI
jgi:hypothetical protein